MSHKSQAINTMKRELMKIQRAQNDCVTGSGVVRRECRYKYQMLTRQAAAFKESIDWMEKMYEGKGVSV